MSHIINRLDKLFFQFFESKVRKLTPDKQDTVTIFRQRVLMRSKQLAGFSLTTVSDNCISNPPRCNNPKSANRLISFVEFRNKQSKKKGRTLKSPPEFTNRFKFSGATQVLPGRESKTHSARKIEPLCCKAFSTLPTAGSDYPTATFGGHAFAKPKFAGST